MQCPECSHANDIRFCQQCGYKRRDFIKSGLHVDCAALDTRLQELFDYDHATKYSRQKDSLQRELESFLAALPGSVILSTVTPSDVCRFLVFKDQSGKTQVHRNSRQFLGQRGHHPCGCPLRLSYKTVDSYIGKLRSIFHAHGRSGEWDKRLALGNPPLTSLSRIIFAVSRANNYRLELRQSKLPLFLCIS